MLISELDPVIEARIQLLLRAGWRLSVELDGAQVWNGHGGMGYVAAFTRDEEIGFGVGKHRRYFDGAGASWVDAIENAAWQVK